MKNLKILLIVFMISLTAVSQEWIVAGVYQDLKLATVGDGKGNDAFTTDVIIRAELQGNQIKNFFIAVQMSYEYADLQGGAYSRYSAGPSITFNRMFIDNLEISYFVNYGGIIRWDRTFLTSEIGMEISYRLRKDSRTKKRSKYRVSLLASLTHRKDLKWRWGGNNKWIMNVYVGVTRDIFK